ncbi:hypothetical protein IWZ03DRAFT_220518 [Phyllosticta citriasiana]|uniref:Secreted protein n=1 Tax=Phyllosticta citriasiana TaxID=595635 RepID=A0ABR1KHA1_9PEZI
MLLLPFSLSCSCLPHLLPCPDSLLRYHCHHDLCWLVLPPGKPAGPLVQISFPLRSLAHGSKSKSYPDFDFAFPRVSERAQHCIPPVFPVPTMRN